MTLNILKGFRQGHLLRMSDEGYVNLQFVSMVRPSCQNNPYYLLEMIDKYFTEVDALISELRSCIDHHKADCSPMAALASYIERKSSSFGAERVRYACTLLIQACLLTQKEEISEALDCLKREFIFTRKTLTEFAVLEYRIVTEELMSK